jgi:hypothetical protein
VPNDNFTGSYQDMWVNCFNWIVKADETGGARQFFSMLAPCQFSGFHGGAEEILAELSGFTEVNNVAAFSVRPAVMLVQAR